MYPRTARISDERRGGCLRRAPSAGLCSGGGMFYYVKKKHTQINWEPRPFFEVGLLIYLCENKAKVNTPFKEGYMLMKIFESIVSILY